MPHRAPDGDLTLLRRPDARARPVLPHHCCSGPGPGPSRLRGRRREIHPVSETPFGVVVGQLARPAPGAVARTCGGLTLTRAAPTDQLAPIGTLESRRILWSRSGFQTEKALS